MSFVDLRSFLRHLAAKNDLRTIDAEVDSDQEITIVQHRVLAAGGPALLFNRVKGSPYRLVSNLFGSQERVRAVFGRHPAEIGEELAGLADQLMPPRPSSLWNNRRSLLKVFRARIKSVSSGEILQQQFAPPDLNKLPCLKCWPLDGGAFFTLPLVYTVDPMNGKGNLGIYRMQRYDAESTGMHWQIEKGGGFHFQRACAQNIPLPLSVFLGGPPALTLAAIAPLPEGIDERILAALILGRPLEMIKRQGTGHSIPARAEFVLEGEVRPGDLKREGPFGDHLGHYSHSADFPVFRVQRMLARKDAVYPATVVGKPPQEDYYIGEALQELTIPLLKVLKPGIADLWAYPETGFHPLAVAAVQQRYRKEGLKHALAILGEGQLSLTKVLIVVDHDVNVRDFRAVSRALWENFDPVEGLHLLAPTAQDTLDFTGPAINIGSRLILLATSKKSSPIRKDPPPSPPKPDQLHKDILKLQTVGEAFLIVQVAENFNRENVLAALGRNPLTSRYLFQVLVSPDVPTDDLRLTLWGWFTRFDPLNDLHPASRELLLNKLVLHTPIAIDATWKEGYRQPVAFDPAKAALVAKRWSDYGIDL